MGFHFRDLERHYLNEIKGLRGELCTEKEKQASLTKEFDHSSRYYSLQLAEQENTLKQELFQLKQVIYAQKTAVTIDNLCSCLT